MTGQESGHKVYELREITPGKPDIKADMNSLVHLYAGFAMCCDGEKTLRVPLTDEQIVQLAADACELAAKILRWEVQRVQSGKAADDAPSGSVG